MQNADTSTEPSVRHHLPRLFTPIVLRGLELRNRTIKAGTYEGMAPGGVPSAALVEHHRRIAAGGIGMTTVAYCSVSPDGRTFPEQLTMRPEIEPRLRELTAAVHAEGAAASLQLGHCGYFSKNPEVTGGRSLGPSRLFNAYGFFKGMVWSKAMDAADLDQVVADFARAAERAVACGFDAVELHFGHGYLLSQFLSPWSNRRRDEYGGSLQNRLRLPLRVVAAVRAAVGPDVPVLAKTNLRDGFRGGLEIDEAVEVARALEVAGVDALVPSGGFTSKSPLFLLRGGRPLNRMIEVEQSSAQRMALRLFGPLVVRKVPYEESFFRDLALQLRNAVHVPTALLGGVHSAAALGQAMADGFDLVVLGRPLIYDPTFVEGIRNGSVAVSGCDHCNECIAEMDAGGVRCVRPEAPGHARIPFDFQP